MPGKIILGVTGSIAAYKSPALVRLFKRGGFEVKCVLTDAAQKFVTTETLGTLSGNKVYTGMFSDERDDFHISLAKWADIIVVAPASCDTIAKIASGRCEDLLAATVISFRKNVLVAPAMNSAMWRHPATVENVGRLEKFGYTIIPPEKGELACGDEDIGRMAEPENILTAVEKILK